MTRTVITGGSGFVGGHLARACTEAGDEVIAVSRSGASESGGALSCDLLDPDATRRLIAELKPEVVHHFAALASTGRSWRDPVRCLADNQAMTWNLLEAVRSEVPDARVLIAGSGESYGRPQALPVSEDHPLAPATPYSLAKTACDLSGGLFATAHGLRVVRARGFNHAGPGQAGEFLIGSLVEQVAVAIGEGKPEITVRTGNATIRRDYTDVRDAALAYRDLALRGESSVVNVCSGRSASTAEVVEHLALAATEWIAVKHEVDPDLVRPHETAEVTGDPSLIREMIGWQATTPLEQTVADSLAAALSG